MRKLSPMIQRSVTGVAVSYHDRLWHANAHVRTTCRGQRITALYLYGDYDRERWTVSHFDDGGFDLNAEEDEDGIVDHEHELEFYG